MSKDTSWNYENSNNIEYYSRSGGTTAKFINVDGGTAAGNEMADVLNERRKEPGVREVHYAGIKDIASVHFATSKRKELPPGQYIYMEENYAHPSRLVPTTFRKDKYIALPSITDSIITDVNEFLANEALYRSIDPEMCYKMGMLLYGAPGEGKTSLIRNVVANHLPEDAITIVLGRDNFPYHDMLTHMKKTLEGRLKVFIFEELTTHTESNSDAERLLSFLDGENSLDKSIIFATTNYPELLPGNIVDRASRIDKMYKISSPNNTERSLILSHYLKRPATEEEVLAAEGISTAYLKEIAITSLIKKVSVIESVALIESRKLSVKNNFKSDAKFGLAQDE